MNPKIFLYNLLIKLRNNGIEKFNLSNLEIFLYKFLIKLKNNGIEEFNLSALEKFYIDFIPLLKEYKLDDYADNFNKTKNFSFCVLEVFAKFELGTYIKGILRFYDEPIILESLENCEIDVADNTINEIAMYFAFQLNDNSVLKKSIEF